MGFFDPHVAPLAFLEQMSLRDCSLGFVLMQVWSYSGEVSAS